MSDHDGHTINVGPVTIGEPLARPPVENHHAVLWGPRVSAVVAGLRAENAALAAQVERIHSRRVEDLHADWAIIDSLRAENALLRGELDAIEQARTSGKPPWPCTWQQYGEISTRATKAEAKNAALKRAIDAVFQSDRAAKVQEATVICEHGLAVYGSGDCEACDCG